MLLLLLAGVLLWPAVQPHPSDGFPVSTYPMFARRSGTVVRLATAVGLDAAGEVHRLGPHTISGGDEVVLAAEQLRLAVAEGDESVAALCREIARRVDDAEIVTVEVRTEMRDAVDDVKARREAIDTVVHARCEVPRDRPARARRGTTAAGGSALVAGWSVLWLVARLRHNLGLADLPERRWYPVGILAPLDSPPPAWLAGAVIVLAIPRGRRRCSGVAGRVTIPVWAVALLLVGTYVSCWGQLFHTENLLVLHALVLAGWAVARRPVDARTVLTALVVVLVAVYVVAGVAKLRGSGWAWFEGDILRNKVAFDNLRKAALGSTTSPFASGAVGTDWLWPPLAALTIVVELGAPVILLRRRWAPWWIAAAWGFHVGILVLMAIGFPYQLVGVAYAPLLPVERIRLPWVRQAGPAMSSVENNRHPSKTPG